MGDGTKAVGKLLISIIAAVIIGLSVYSSFLTFSLGQYVGIPYAAELASFLAGLFTLVLVYFLMMTLKSM